MIDLFTASCILQKGGLPDDYKSCCVPVSLTGDEIYQIVAAVEPGSFYL
jgi:hypothetical protein